MSGSEREAGPGLSFEDYVRARATALVRFAYMLTADWALAEDLVQEALVRVHLKWPRVVSAEHPDAYVRKVVLRQFLTWRRRRSSGEAVMASLPELPAPDWAGFAGRQADRDAAWRLLATLSRQQRAVMVLRYYEDLPDDRIAELLGCTTSTVRVHASRALAALRPQAGWLREQRRIS